jgi:tRNA(Ile2) C34 agmatinyltransferase TiaS
MPLRRYAPLKPPCRLCGEGFDHMQSAGARDLERCHRCGQAVRRVDAQPVNSPQLSAPLSVSRARQAGFKVFKRTSGGEFERQ